MNSVDIKASMLSHCLFSLHHEAAITEYGGKGVSGIADVFSVTRAGMTHEFEVKVSAADLAGEITAVQWIIENKGLFDGTTPPRKMSKTSKHRHYLGFGRDVYYDIALQPNRFSFVVPTDLEEKAKQGLKGSPYGLYVVEQTKWGGEPKCVKRADYLHKEKATEETLYNIVHKACLEIQTVRLAQSRGRRCTSCHEEMPGRCDNCNEKIKKEREYKKKSNACWAKVSGLTGAEQSQAFRECMAI